MSVIAYYSKIAISSHGIVVTMLSLFLFAHAGHAHDMSSIDSLDHCMPVIIGMGAAIVVLIGIIVYLLVTRKPTDKSDITTVKSGKK